MPRGPRCVCVWILWSMWLFLTERPQPPFYIDQNCTFWETCIFLRRHGNHTSLHSALWLLFLTKGNDESRS